MSRARFLLLLSCVFAVAPTLDGGRAQAQSEPGAAKLPAFDAATIKPPDPNASFRKMGFYGEPGGRVFLGGQIRMLIESAFNLRRFQVAAGPEWIDSQWFDITAVPPEGSSSRQIQVPNAEPSPEQRLMLQSLLRDRFSFKFHFETKDGDVYILTRGNKPLELAAPKNPAADPRAIVTMKSGGIVDGEAHGIDTSMDYLAFMLSDYLKTPVLNQTGISGSYDFELAATDPENQDMVAGVLNVVNRLGLKLKRGRGPIRTLVIDQIDEPTEN